MIADNIIVDEVAFNLIRVSYRGFSNESIDIELKGMYTRFTPCERLRSRKRFTSEELRRYAELMQVANLIAFERTVANN